MWQGGNLTQGELYQERVGIPTLFIRSYQYLPLKLYHIRNIDATRTPFHTPFIAKIKITGFCLPFLLNSHDYQETQ